jgi:dTDP-4-amino-4,6-dideoxygalactose transaminase
LDEIQAALLRVKLRRLDVDNQYRREIAEYYIGNIQNPEIQLPSFYNENIPSNNHVWHIFVIRHSERDRLRKYLNENGIQTLIHYPIPPHKQGAFREINCYSYPITEQIHREVLSLPISPVMKKKDFIRVVELTNTFK